MSMFKRTTRIDSEDDDSDFEAKTGLKRRSSVSFPLSPLVLIDGISRKCSLYNRLPQEPIKLSVLKLDGTSFDIEVMKSATVGELKEAVESAFSHMPKKGQGKISWRHVWGHFCLSYCGRKLIADNDDVINYGIKDGDQLQFTRHVTDSSVTIRKLSNKRSTSSKKWQISNSYAKDEEQNAQEDAHSDIEKGNLDGRKSEGFSPLGETKLDKFLLGWFLYSRLAIDEDISNKGKSRRSKCAKSFWKGLRKIMTFYSDRPYARRHTERFYQ